MGGVRAHNAAGAFKNRSTYILRADYFGIILGLHDTNFRLLTLTKKPGIDDALAIGWLTIILYAIAALKMA